MSNYPSWLDDAVIYNIFPASFRDSNGDGIGDLPGIIEKLDYIQSLGVNLIWINPIYDSPFQDGGYDIRDYYKVAERYGKNEDVPLLCAEAKKRGMRIMLDLVPGHTSIEHPWFKAAASGEKTEYDNRYIWTDHVFRIVEGPFLGGDTERNGKYLINFFSFQPALNFGYLNPKEPWQLPIDHPDSVATRNELKNIMDFWLKKGVSGFRVDIAPSLVKDDVDSRGLEIIYSDLRGWMEEVWPEAVLLAEWSEPKDAIRCGFHMDFLLHCTPEYTHLFRQEDGANIIPNDDACDSYFRPNGKGRVGPFMDYLQDQLACINRTGLISMPTGNHDLPRIGYNRSMEDLKVAYLFIFTLPVVPALYYGDEIGMRHLPNTPYIEGAYHRAASRTPMQWEKSECAGFSETSPEAFYLPLDPDVDRPTVELQEADSDSLLWFVRKLIQLRKENPVVGVAGDLEVLHAENGGPVVYRRRKGEHSVIVAVNPSGEKREMSLDLPGTLEPMLAIGEVSAKGNKIEMGPVGGGVFELKDDKPRQHFS